ncbi:FG-GAP repeat domain-containing protein [Synoicihabitans lomoniglobus]|uniref:VCBS repeat-containing protein n=1 Tax=Synoicihabitans lomoniglobus TaxID=2909285 RepID=A0AAE9ZUE9_9BACT|nr:VCBS repeat-containing protein [Opitutaceae bacterium LMO-M01]WED63224.1 VCBS repeat-containing protein [Opitutaceae bacterium LMO-M01]
MNTSRHCYLAAALGIGALGLLLSGCGKKPSVTVPRPTLEKTTVEWATDRYVATPIGKAGEGPPWISHVRIADLDQDGRNDVLACDDKALTVLWLRQVAPGQFEETVLAEQLPAPVHVEAVDMDADGDLDLLVSCMGQVFPNNDHIGSLLILENDGAQNFTPRVVAENVMRVTDARAADFDGDGLLDLAVAQFGYDQGEIRWMRNRGDGTFESKVLLSLSGAINVCVADMNGDRALDIVAVVSQQWEEVHYFENSGSGYFTDRILFGSTNEDYGSSGISLSDINRDGRMDVLYTNGDGFAYADPGKRPWHGLQWLENLGQGAFKFHRVGDMPGAYSPVGADLEGRGVMDIVSVSGFNDWQNPDAISLVVFRNDGTNNFTMQVLAKQPVQLISCDVGDLTGDGIPDIVAGAFHSYPPYEKMGRLTLWTARKSP